MLLVYYLLLKFKINYLYSKVRFSKKKMCVYIKIVIFDKNFCIELKKNFGIQQIKRPFSMQYILS